MVLLKGCTIILDNGSATIEDKADFALKLEYLQNSGTKEIEIDLGVTSFLPSELMGLLMWKKRDFDKMGIHLKITKISQSLKDLFDETKLSQYFDMDNCETTNFPY